MDNKNPHHACERWLHVPSRITYRVVFEMDGICDLEPLHGETIRIRRSLLQSSDNWQRIP